MRLGSLDGRAGYDIEAMRTTYEALRPDELQDLVGGVRDAAENVPTPPRYTTTKSVVLMVCVWWEILYSHSMSGCDHLSSAIYHSWRTTLVRETGPQDPQYATHSSRDGKK